VGCEVLGFGPGFFGDVAGFVWGEEDFDGDGVAVDQVEGGVQGSFGVECVGIDDVLISGFDAADPFDGVGLDVFVAEFQSEKIEATVVFEKVQGADGNVADCVGVKGVVGDGGGRAVQDGFGQGFNDVFLAGVVFRSHGFGDEDPLEFGKFGLGLFGYKVLEF